MSRRQSEEESKMDEVQDDKDTDGQRVELADDCKLEPVGMTVEAGERGREQRAGRW